MYLNKSYVLIFKKKSITKLADIFVNLLFSKAMDFFFFLLFFWKDFFILEYSYITELNICGGSRE